MSDKADSGWLGEVSLAQYAAVQVARGLDAPLADVLANERIDPVLWPQAEIDWGAKLGTPADEALRTAFTEALRAARQRYRRRWAPLDEDLEQWLAFSRHWAADPHPLDMLERLGMKVNEFLALQQCWQVRTSQDPVLAARAHELLAAHEPPPLPEVTPGPLAMDPLPDPDDSPRLRIREVRSPKEPSANERTTAVPILMRLPAPPPEESVAPTADNLDATGEISLEWLMSALAQGELPFAGAAEPPPRPEPTDEDHPDVGATTTIDQDLVALVRAAMPFQARDAGEPEPLSPAAASAPAARVDGRAFATSPEPEPLPPAAASTPAAMVDDRALATSPEPAGAQPPLERAEPAAAHTRGTGRPYRTAQPPLERAEPAARADREGRRASGAPEPRSVLDETSVVDLTTASETLPFADAGAPAPKPIAGELPLHPQAGETSYALPIVRDDTLPFAKRASDPAERESPEAPAASNEAERMPPASTKSILDQTLLGADLGLHLSLPFTEASQDEPAPKPIAGELPLHPQAGETSYALPIVHDDSVPFGKKSEPRQAGEQPSEPELEPRASHREPPAKPASELDETLLGDVPVLAKALPFDEPTGERPIGAEPAIEPAVHPDAGATSLSLPIVRGDDLPFAQRSSKTAFETTVGASAGASAFRAATLTMRQFAAVRVQIELEPERTDEVLARYRLTARAKQAVDEELRQQCAADPQIAQAWTEAYGTYLDWWRKNRGGK